MKGSKVHSAPAKIVDMNNKPIQQDQVGGPEELQGRMVAALRQLAEGIESGSMRMPDRIIILPQFGTEVQLIHLGDEVPVEYLEGMLHKMVTRMALQ
jgi:hypothetical protein